MWELAVPVSIGVVLFIIIGFMFATLYRRYASRDALVAETWLEMPPVPSLYTDWW